MLHMAAAQCQQLGWQTLRFVFVDYDDDGVYYCYHDDDHDDDDLVEEYKAVT